MPDQKLNSRMFPDVYKSLGVTISDLGCIMLDVEPFKVTELVADGEKDLFFGDTPDLKYAQGAVAEKSAHITLLYGLMQPGPEWKSYVDEVLVDWTPPPVTLSGVTYFPSNIKGQDYAVIVGEVVPTPELVEGNSRLRLLPHIDTFPEYVPHLTLAYVNARTGRYNGGSSTVEKWIQALNDEFQGQSFPAKGINYGGEK